MFIGDKEILKYLEGNCNSHEAETMQNWIAKSNENRIQFDALKKVYNQSTYLNEFESLDLDQEWSDFKSILPEFNQETQSEVPKLKIITLPRLVTAASVLLLVLFFMNDSEELLITKRSLASGMSFTLSDGSNVDLQAYSSLTYPQSFEKYNNRKITLDGSALFDIRRDPEKDFIIEANETQTVVVGTNFNLSSSAAETLIEVYEGTVSFKLIGDEASKLLLNAGEKAGFVGGKLKRIVEQVQDTLVESIAAPIAKEKIVEEPKKIKKAPVQKTKKVNPYGNQSNYRLNDVIELMNERFGKKFKKHKKCKIDKNEVVLINPNGDIDFVIEQLKIYYKLEIEKGKCDDCLELRSISRK